MAQFKWTEVTVLDALRATYLPAHQSMVQEEWAFLTQVLLRAPGRGYEEMLAAGRTPNLWTMNERKIDAFLVRNWSGGKYGHERLAIEVKVTKADYRNDTDTKRAPAEVSAHRCAYAAPEGLIDPTTLPEGWGLIEVSRDENGAFTTKWVKKAVRRQPTANMDHLVSAGFRRASRAEEQIRRAETTAAEVVGLRAELETMRGQLTRAQEARDREMGRAKAARAELIGLAGAQECADCGHKLTWGRGGHNDSRWYHPDRDNEDACMRMRRTAYEQSHQAGIRVSYPYEPIPAAKAD